MRNNQLEIKVKRMEEKFLRDLIEYECPARGGCAAEKKGLCQPRASENFRYCKEIKRQVTLIHARGKLVLDELERDILLSLIRAYVDSEGEHDYIAGDFSEKLAKLSYSK